jgi:excisionase family DNA binding protein
MIEKRRTDTQEAEPRRNDELLTLEEAAALLKVPKSWIYDRTRRGAIPHLKLGKYLRFPVADLLRWMHTQRRPAGEGTLPASRSDKRGRDPGSL